MKKITVSMTFVLVAALFLFPPQAEAAFLKNFFNSIFNGNQSQQQVSPPPIAAPINKEDTTVPSLQTKGVSQKCTDEKWSVGKVLTYGMFNKDVIVLQDALICNGYLSGSADGHYGKLTLSAVALFQKEYDIAGDGTLAGEKTLNLLGIRLTSPSDNSTCQPDSIDPNPPVIGPNETTTLFWATRSGCQSISIQNATQGTPWIHMPALPVTGVSVGPFFTTRDQYYILRAAYEPGCHFPNGVSTTGQQCTYAPLFASTTVIIRDNDPDTAVLTLNKTISGGGPSVATDWQLHATIFGQTQPTLSGSTGVSGTIPAGQFVLSESGPAGYTPTDWSCNGGSLSGSTLTISAGQNVTCTITNKYQSSTTITLRKRVVNDSGGSSLQSVFQPKLDGVVVAWDTPITVSPGIHFVSEVPSTGYRLTGFELNCSRFGPIRNGTAVVVAEDGQNKECRIVNDDSTPPPPQSCTIRQNSFSVPSTTTISSGLRTDVSWATDGCKGVMLEVTTGGEERRYWVPSSGSRTFYTTTSQTDNTLDITLIATDLAHIVSETKTVRITDVVAPSQNQCTINSLTATPNPTSNTVTIAWSAPSECYRVFIDIWAPDAQGRPAATGVYSGPGWNTSTLSFNATGSRTFTINGDTTFVLRAQGGAGYTANGNFTLLSTRSIDVDRQ